MSSPEVGSSSNMIFGSEIKAIARDSLLSIPPDSYPGFSLLILYSSTSSRIFFIFIEDWGIPLSKEKK